MALLKLRYLLLRKVVDYYFRIFFGGTEMIFGSVLKSINVEN